MKKILLLVITLTMTTMFLVGCSVADYKANREQFMQDCQADTECVEFVIQDADTIIKQTPTYLDLQTELDLANQKLQEHEDRISSLEELTEEEYISHIKSKWNEFNNGNGDCGMIYNISRVDNGNGYFDITIYMNGRYADGCSLELLQYQTIMQGLHSELPNYTVVQINIID